MKEMKWWVVFWVQAFLVSLLFALFDFIFFGELRSTFADGAVAVLAVRVCTLQLGGKR